MKTKTPRKPAEMELVGGKGSRQRAWEVIRQHAGAFTCDQIARKIKVNDRTVYTYLASLTKGGFLQGSDMTGMAIGAKKSWTLIRDNGVEAPRLTRDGQPIVQGLGTEAMWRTMRIIHEFNSDELAAHASTSGATVMPGTAKAYLHSLLQAGYLLVAKPAQSFCVGHGAAQARYRLAPGKYTGPRPPMIQRTKSVYDPNLGKVVWQEEVNLDDDL